jgi:phosphoribosylaminoimidazole carboxylase/phosphoribosylaminoimidazole-succinocarboxamide synthase
MTDKHSQSKTKYAFGRLLTEGKTKWVYQGAGNEDQVIVVSKDDITAGDGAKHDVLANKGRIANQTTCNVFRLLAACGIPVGFTDQIDDVSFVAPNCRMLPYEVVVRREAHGSFLKRSPHLSKGQLFPRLVVEFFLKTKGRRWKEHELVCDDPLMTYADGAEVMHLFHPGTPRAEPFLELPVSEVFMSDTEATQFPEMSRIARRAFLALEKCWQLEGQKLVDFKVEFGLDSHNRLLLADVIDNDSWRVVENDRYIDKQMYRDGGALDDVLASYRRVADITSHFRVPTQRIVLWRGSDSDNTEAFARALAGLESLMVVVTRSAHKEPIAAALILQEMLQQVPDSVVIAYIGRSNGAGPTLAANSTVPVITVPASAKEFPDDVWSSLRAPSKVPVLTVLEPGNAVLAALQVLASRNPQIYARLRLDLEERMVNTIQV